MKQLALFENLIPTPTLSRQHFSHDNVAQQHARIALETDYAPLLMETNHFNRQLVSFQANKTEQLHSWIKYREGFSASLVEILLKEFEVEPGQTILEPFAGSCTTLLVAAMYGINGVGIELLPNCHLAWEAKSRAFSYDLPEIETIYHHLKSETPPAVSDAFPHLTITESAFPLTTEQSLMAYSRWFEQARISENTRILGKFLLMSILEQVSYTRKDGQYLRWDGRATKIVAQNEKRLKQSKKVIKGIHKGNLPTVRTALTKAMEQVLLDIAQLQKQQPPPSQQNLIHGNVLYTLPTMEPAQFTAVITSPPYANRYDYTRTYALELAYLGVQDSIFNLRQEQLSCTVENKPKLTQLHNHYIAINAEDRFNQIINIIDNNQALLEINQALKKRAKRGEVNNKGIISMIQQYFTELTFVFAELHRVCQPGAFVAFVNDNVRYAGEVIPVDLLSTCLAKAVGFHPIKVYVLPQRKGNSSQQMGKFGREALRKSITVWQKPAG